MDYVLDACALIAFLNDEAGADTIAGLLVEAETGTTHLYISSIQALEVYYDRIYVKGLDYANVFLESLYASPVTVLNEISLEVVREAGKLKTKYSISLADSVACATAFFMSLPLISSDHSELSAIERRESVKFYWFR